MESRRRKQVIEYGWKGCVRNFIQFGGSGIIVQLDFLRNHGIFIEFFCISQIIRKEISPIRFCGDVMKQMAAPVSLLHGRWLLYIIL
jgi:hypothetical protein